MKRILNKLAWYKNQLKSSSITSWYVFCMEKFSVNTKKVLLQSKYGDDLGGNIFYLMKELVENHIGYKVYLAYKATNKDKYQKILSNYGIKNVTLVEIHKPYYWYLLATCKYLINDTTFHPLFIKKKEQVYLNTWHGTPLKKMGFDMAQTGYVSGNIQRNFLASNYLLYPNRFMRDVMIESYRLKNLFTGSVILEGYPRNSVLMNGDRRTLLRKKLGVDNLHVTAYMPTWRGNEDRNKVQQHINDIIRYLEEIDCKLEQDQLFYVKLHPFIGNRIDFSQYNKIKAFPNNMETYDFLSATDCLVTDYSSVMFDYACSKRNIVLFTYDEEEYLEDRGMYIDLKQLPFGQVKNVNDLIVKIKNGEDYTKDLFIKAIVELENNDSAKRILNTVLKNENECHLEQLKCDGKENVFVFVDGLVKNGITSAVFNLLNSVDTNKRNYFAVFRRNGIKAQKDKLMDIPNNIGLLSIENFEKTVFELIACFFYYKFNFNNKIIKYYVNECYKRMFCKYYGNIQGDSFIQFIGYSRETLQMFMHADKKFVFVHSDMKRELTGKTNQHKDTLVTSYRQYDKVVGVSERTANIAKEVAGGIGRYCVVHNCFDYKSILDKANKNIVFDKDTECTTWNVKGLEGLLSSSGKKIITIGRFSKEKEHIRLLDAFNMYWKRNRDASLIIIGGYGNEYYSTLRYIRKLECYRNICVIKSINNPMPILKRCDLFVLTSSYEGLPVVFFEADCLGIPILSTNIDGPKQLLTQYDGGLLVEESAKAIYNGMLEFDKGNIQLLNIDMNEFNNRCLSEFERMLME